MNRMLLRTLFPLTRRSLLPSVAGRQDQRIRKTRRRTIGRLECRHPWAKERLSSGKSLPLNPTLKQ